MRHRIQIWGFIMAEATKIKNLVKTVDVVAGTVTFLLGNGDKHVFEAKKSPATIQGQLLLHGGSQKIGDAITRRIAEAKEEGATDPFAAASQMAKAEIAKLLAGNWTERVASGGIFVVALARIKNTTVEAMQAALEKVSEKDLAGIQTSPAVKAVVAEIKAERAKAKAKGAGSDALAALKV